MATITATCHTVDCQNAGHAIDLEVDPEYPPDTVVCGVCGQTIDEAVTS